MNPSFQLKNLTPVQWIVLFYFAAITVSSILLYLPVAHRPGVELTYMDALFTAVSAVSVTGLAVVNTSETFSPVGYAFLIVMFQLGGIGIMTIGSFLWLATGSRIGIRRRRMIMVDHNRSDLAGLVRLMRDILFLAVLIELVGAVVIALYLQSVYGYGTEAWMFGLFASTSAFTNAGYDIFGDSLIRFAGDYFIQTIHIFLIIAGAIGFPVLVELKEWMAHPDRGRFRFSLFTKITVSTYFTLFFLGAAMLWLLEWDNHYDGLSWHRALFYSVFHSVSARSGGMATMDVNDYTTPSQLALSFLMFVGASPSSVGGGIRTTTLAVVALAVFSYARGQNHVRTFRRELLDEDVRKASVVFAAGVLIVATATLVLATVQPDASLAAILFEVSSAFGTCGLSLGLTPELTTAGQFTVMTMMFLGRIGVLSLLFLLRMPATPDVYRYPRERVIIG